MHSRVNFSHFVGWIIHWAYFLHIYMQISFCVLYCGKEEIHNEIELTIY